MLKAGDIASYLAGNGEKYIVIIVKVEKNIIFARFSFRRSHENYSFEKKCFEKV